MSPSGCKNERDLLGMRETIKDRAWGYISIQHDGTVHIIKQRSGHPPTESIAIPRHIFQRFVTWYDKDQE